MLQNFVSPPRRGARTEYNMVMEDLSFRNDWSVCQWAGTQAARLGVDAGIGDMGESRESRGRHSNGSGRRLAGRTRRTAVWLVPWFEAQRIAARRDTGEPASRQRRQGVARRREGPRHRRARSRVSTQDLNRLHPDKTGVGARVYVCRVRHRYVIRQPWLATEVSRCCGSIAIDRSRMYWPWQPFRSTPKWTRPS